MVCLFFSLNECIAVCITARSVFYLFADAQVGVIFRKFGEGRISSAHADMLEVKEEYRKSIWHKWLKLGHSIIQLEYNEINYK